MLIAILLAIENFSTFFFMRFFLTFVSPYFEENIAQTIILERYLPLEEKTIKPVGVGGIAGKRLSEILKLLNISFL